MEFFTVACPFVFVVFTLYWTIRYAVRHALKDADERREEAAREPRP